MRLVIFGTGDFGVPSVEALYETPHEIAALITQESAPAKNPKKPLPVPKIVQLAQAHATPIYRFANVKSPKAVACLRELMADLFFVCDYGQILSPEGISAATFGGINLHGSLLPKYRGAAPVQWALLHGDAQTGITVIHITPTVDAGPILAMESTPIASDETHSQLEPRLARLGVPHVLAAVEHFASGVEMAEISVTQDDSLASKAPKIRKSDAEIKWTETATIIRNKIRAFDAWPRAFTLWRREEKPEMRLIPQPVPEIIENQPAWENSPPGTVLALGETLVVKTADAALAFRALQPAGKKMLAIPEFLRGYPMCIGDRLG